MLLWRLSGVQHAEAFDGGYGLAFEGRWDTVGHAVTYSATSPSLCVLEKLVHIEDPALLPDLEMVAYLVPDDIGVDRIGLNELPADWRAQQHWTQQQCDAWYRSRSGALLLVPSVIVPLAESPDVNVVINHSHPAAGSIEVYGLKPFAFDPRLI
jgi:RES domain-containing protein